MNLAAAIQQKWNQTDALTSRVPAERVFVGAAPGSTALPQVSIVPQTENAELTTTRDYLERRSVRVGVRAATYDEASLTRDLFDRSFHLQPLVLGFATLLAFTRIAGGQEQQPAAWHLWYEYEALIQRRR